MLRESASFADTAAVAYTRGALGAARPSAGPEVAEVKLLRALQNESGRLKRMLTHSILDIAGLKDLLLLSGKSRC